jgi:hypothetical protein
VPLSLIYRVYIFINLSAGRLAAFTGAKLCERLHEGVGLPYLLWISIYTGNPRLAQLADYR